MTDSFILEMQHMVRDWHWIQAPTLRRVIFYKPMKDIYSSSQDRGHSDTKHDIACNSVVHLLALYLFVCCFVVASY